MRKQHSTHKHKKDDEEWDEGEKTEWSSVQRRRATLHSSLLGMGYVDAKPGRLVGQVRTAEWGSGVRRKGSLLKREEGV